MLNEIILQGRLTDTPELKTTPSGKSVTSFSLAVERDFSTGDERETDFINIVAWNKTAEFIGKYFTKGKQIIVKGSLQVRRYQTQNGENRYATEVLADKVYFCGDRGNTQQGENYGDNYDTDGFTEVGGTDDLPF
jgi:single-strand DNA-binding protein